MGYKVAADIVVLLHLAFIVFVVAGGILVFRWSKVAWFHIPMLMWGALVEFTGWICPLTPLENNLRLASGNVGYAGGFIENALVPLIYPIGLTRILQLILGSVVIVLNMAIYGTLLWRHLRQSQKGS